ncbi:histidinol-phosphate transaminase [Pontibaca methylaminivorans]|uniref:histidinol-phosphate transaminase n=1 Tax=Pontibaca methylaminivorans TaxID=515897 RepID=UPI002FDABF42
MNRIMPRSGIMDIAPYQGGAARVAGVEDAVKLSSNENPFGPSPRAIEAMRDLAPQSHRYPSSDHAPLRAALGAAHGIDPGRIICGAGSDEIISLLCRAYAGPGDEVLFTEHGFSMYRISAQAVGAKPVEVAERERVTDVDALLAGCTPRTRLVFIANPNNPTGTMIGEEEVARLAEGIPAQALLVLDGAYVEYVEGFDGGASLVSGRGNVVMTRSFSKLYGLGGLRIGWAYAPDAVIDVLNRLRGPFNVSSVALAAAQAALADVEYTDHCRAENARWRGWLSEALAEIGVPSDESRANFILARFGSRAEAEACDLHLQSRGLIVRRVAGYGLPAALRITIGDESACRRVAAAIREFREAGGEWSA